MSKVTRSIASLLLWAAVGTTVYAFLATVLLVASTSWLDGSGWTSFLYETFGAGIPLAVGAWSESSQPNDLFIWLMILFGSSLVLVSALAVAVWIYRVQTVADEVAGRLAEMYKIESFRNLEELAILAKQSTQKATGVNKTTWERVTEALESVKKLKKDMRPFDEINKRVVALRAELQAGNEGSTKVIEQCEKFKESMNYHLAEATPTLRALLEIREIQELAKTLSESSKLIARLGDDMGMSGFLDKKPEGGDVGEVEKTDIEKAGSIVTKFADYQKDGPFRRLK
ncbi:hypothetical protein KC865_00310 [Candidatus Kaiserbacteria bacterium]|nr:hypothetical protein [Candidatus Kaiserbacteria bacterium]USN92411.1 MAG: hypothetical protein H6782_01185 [Candidatus Nomurabacteria bacterium]